MSLFVSREQREAAAAVRDLVRRIDAVLPIVVQAALTRGSGGGASEALQGLLSAFLPRQAPPKPNEPGALPQ